MKYFIILALLIVSCNEDKKTENICNTEQWVFIEPLKDVFSLKLPHTLTKAEVEYNSAIMEQESEIYSKIFEDTIRDESGFILVKDYSARKDKEDSTTLRLRIQALGFKDELILYSRSYIENGWEIFIKKSEILKQKYYCTGYIACTKDKIVLMSSLQTSNKSREAAHQLVDCFLSTFSFLAENSHTSQ